MATAHEIFKYMNLRDKEDIIFCKPDPEDIADKILLILKYEEIRSRLSKRGAQLAKNYYYDATAMHIIKVVENNDLNY
jgi:glycosyltransferase involved in cell wall biosynthesis